MGLGEIIFDFLCLFSEAKRRMIFCYQQLFGSFINMRILLAEGRCQASSQTELNILEATIEILLLF